MALVETRNLKAYYITEAYGVKRTVKAVTKRRGGAAVPKEDKDKLLAEAKKQAAALVKKLGADGYEDREAADKALRRMGKVALEAVRTGTGSKDVEIADRCKVILAVLEKGTGGTAGGGKATFNLDIAGQFVPKAAKKPAPKKPAKK